MIASRIRPEVTNPLTWVLLVEGLGSAGVAQVVFVLNTGSASVQNGAAAVIGFGFVASPWLYLMFVGRALDTPLTRPLAHTAAQRSLWAFLVVHAILFLWVLDGVDEFSAVAAAIYIVPFVGALLFGLLAALQNARRASPGLPRRQAHAYLLAFFVRDVSQATAFLGIILTAWVPVADTLQDALILLFFGGPTVFVVILMYAVLKGQVLGLDGAYRFGIKQTTAVAMVAVVFFVIVESIEQAFAIRSNVLSVAVAGALFLLFRPIQRVSERFAVALIPRTPAPLDIPAAERAKLYRGQVELAWADGPPSAAQAAILERYREQLGLSERQVRRIEAAFVRG